MPLLLLIVIGGCVAPEPRPTPVRRSVQLIDRSVVTSAIEPLSPSTGVRAGAAGAPAEVLAVFETGLIRPDSARARLYGDVDGTTGWSSTAALLIEVVDVGGEVRSVVTVGASQPLSGSGNDVRPLFPLRDTFGPGEVELTRWVADVDPFRIRTRVVPDQDGAATSDLFLVLEPE